MSTKTCPFCAEEIRDTAIKCRYCGSMVGPRPGAGEWFREPGGKMIAGVCTGLARQFGLSVTGIRLAFVVGTFIGGWGLLVYLALWVIMPVRKAMTVSELPRANAPSGAPPANEKSPPSSES